jgi:hypothetical protein
MDIHTPALTKLVPLSLILFLSVSYIEFLPNIYLLDIHQKTATEILFAFVIG